MYIIHMLTTVSHKRKEHDINSSACYDSGTQTYDDEYVRESKLPLEDGHSITNIL